MINCASPLPSWIGPGQASTPAALRPSSRVPPWWPSSISKPTTALQLPWVGKALNWHGHPYAQLQLANSRALIVHSSCVIVLSLLDKAAPYAFREPALPVCPSRSAVEPPSITSEVPV